MANIDFVVNSGKKCYMAISCGHIARRMYVHKHVDLTET